MFDANRISLIFAGVCGGFLISACYAEPPLEITDIEPLQGGFSVDAVFGGEDELKILARRYDDEPSKSLWIEPCRIAYSKDWAPESQFVQPLLTENGVDEDWRAVRKGDGIQVEVTGGYQCSREYRPGGMEEPEPIDWDQACLSAIVMIQFDFKVHARSKPGDLSGVAAICEATAAQ